MLTVNCSIIEAQENLFDALLVTEKMFVFIKTSTS